MELPQTLHGQLYLLAFHQLRRRLHLDDWKPFDFALRAAMLTDLYLTGRLEDRGGKAWPTTAAQPADPVLRAALNATTGRDWVQLISYKSSQARQVVRHQLETTGWVIRRESPVLGVIPTVSWGLYDEDMVRSLADRVVEALQNAIEDRSADPRPLAVGLLACQAQMRAVSTVIDNMSYQEGLGHMTLAAIEPISGLPQAIAAYHEQQRIERTFRLFGGDLDS